MLQGFECLFGLVFGDIGPMNDVAHFVGDDELHGALPDLLIVFHERDGVVDRQFGPGCGKSVRIETRFLAFDEHQVDEAEIFGEVCGDMHA